MKETRFERNRRILAIQARGLERESERRREEREAMEQYKQMLKDGHPSAVLLSAYCNGMGAGPMRQGETEEEHRQRWERWREGRYGS